MTIEHKQISAEMQAAVQECLENMAFMSVMPAECEVPLSDMGKDLQWACVPICSPWKANLICYLPPQLSEELAENVYGAMGDDVSPEMKTDLIGEIANTIAGRFMKGMIKGDETFTLDVPQIGVAGESVDEEGFSFHFTVGEWAFVVLLRDLELEVVEA